MCKLKHCFENTILLLILAEAPNIKWLVADLHLSRPWSVHCHSGFGTGSSWLHCAPVNKYKMTRLRSTTGMPAIMLLHGSWSITREQETAATSIFTLKLLWDKLGRSFIQSLILTLYQISGDYMHNNYSGKKLFLYVCIWSEWVLTV